MSIHGGLLEAYLGYNEDEWEREYEGFKTHAADNEMVPYKEWSYKRAEKVIRAHTPKQRLAIYLEWNGILGYTETIWDISSGMVDV